MKTVIKIVVAVAVLAVVAGGVAFGKDYYENRYVGSTYYAQVPEDMTYSLLDIVDDGGEVFDKGYTFELVAYDEQGDRREVEIRIYDDSVQPPAPGSYMQLELSKTLVLNWQPVAKADVPATVMGYMA
jgi:uncharacterized protein (TIGR01655 family)